MPPYATYTPSGPEYLHSLPAPNTPLIPLPPDSPNTPHRRPPMPPYATYTPSGCQLSSLCN